MTPDNTGYMIAGYIAAAVVYLGYTLVLVRRRRDIARRWRAMPTPAAPPAAPPPPDAAA
ncbi:MAG TPA: hypothetical protein VHM30_03000 [Gemmatimonadaceae bacterium]|nr:hypothetical protein [Gemmatimonadaceae bacterium]